MTLTVCVFADPCFALDSRSESSGAMRENRPFAVGLLQRCPNAIPVANTRTNTELRRLPQAALCRSLRPSAFFRCLVTIAVLTLSSQMGERSSYLPVDPLHGNGQLACVKLLNIRWL